MEYEHEIKNIKRRQDNDFDFLMLAMRDLRVTFRTKLDSMSQELATAGQIIVAVGQSMAYLSREVDERLNQVEGRMRLQDQRFSTMLGAVEDTTEAWKPEIEAIKARLDQLENRDSAA